MIKPICFKCKDELDCFGAILISPPSINSATYCGSGTLDDFQTTFKFHLCMKCYNQVFTFIRATNN